MTTSISRAVPLAPLTTLGVGGSGDYVAEVHSDSELREVLLWATNEKLPVTILGGGSNVLVSDSGVKGLVVMPRFTDCTFHHDGDRVFMRAGAGVVLDDVIRACVHQGLWGMENLSGIPGTVGGVPVQNVGAYGVEAHDIVHAVRVYDMREHVCHELTRDECQFGYRSSLFKKAEGEQYIITHVTFMLSRERQPRVLYRDLASYFAHVPEPSLTDIREAVIEIRKGKFPDWHTVGTAGSFFKNPIVDAETGTKLRAQYSELPMYEVEGGHYKIALGWILDKVLHLKGYREGNVGLYSEQALVVVNYGGATSHDVLAFSERIIQKIFSATGILVEREVVFFE